MIDLTAPFGNRNILNIDKGDLLCWHEWQVIEKTHKINTFWGFVRSSSEYYGNREISYAHLICSETGDEIKILAVRIRKANTN